MKELYRYERNINSLLDFDGFLDIENEPKVTLHKLKVVKETEKTFVVKMSGLTTKTKRVFKNAKNSYAYETEEKALDNYKRRCKKNLAYSKFNLKAAEIFYKHSKTI